MRVFRYNLCIMETLHRLGNIQTIALIQVIFLMGVCEGKARIQNCHLCSSYEPSFTHPNLIPTTACNS